MIYVPNYNENNCIIIKNSDVIRVYDNTPYFNNEINYTDYFIKSDYMFVNSIELITDENLISKCVAHENITTQIYYRQDFFDILMLFLVIAFITLFLPTMLILRIGRRFK